MEPHIILGVSANASEKDIDNALRILSRKWRPNSNLRNLEEATEMMREINAAHRAMLRRAQAKATARAGESSSSPAHRNHPSSSECPGSASNQASSSHTPNVNKSSGDGSDRITSSSHTLTVNKALCDGSDRIPSSSHTPTVNRALCDGSDKIPSSSHTPTVNTSPCDGSDRIPPKIPCPIRKQSKDSDHRPQRTFSSFLPEPLRRSSSSTNTPSPSPDIDLTNEYNDSFLIGRMSKEWVHPIKFTLEDLFHGKRFKVHLERYQIVGKRRPVVLLVDVPAGCATGSDIIFKNSGHENRDGRRQDIVLVIEEAKHRDFTRIQDDLSMDVEFPWDDRLTQGKQSMQFEGLDGQGLMFTIGPCRNHTVEGTVLIYAAGMPIHGDPLGLRGNLIIHWKISKTG